VTAALLLAAAIAAPGAPRHQAPTDPPPAATEAERAERLEVAFGMIHGSPSPAFWRALGPEAVPELERVARDGSALPGRRARAIEGLSHIGGSRARGILGELAASEELPFPVRAAALEGAGRLLPPADLQRVLEPALRGARRPADRAVAAEVLAERLPDPGCRAVRSRVASEAERDRGTFWRALRRCSAQGR